MFHILTQEGDLIKAEELYILGEGEEYGEGVRIITEENTTIWEGVSLSKAREVVEEVAYEIKGEEKDRFNVVNIYSFCHSDI